jgi:hypothetical protein
VSGRPRSPQQESLTPHRRQRQAAVGADKVGNLVIIDDVPARGAKGSPEIQSEGDGGSGQERELSQSPEGVFGSHRRLPSGRA